jgi:hypothetical protein
MNILIVLIFNLCKHYVSSSIQIKKKEKRELIVKIFHYMLNCYGKYIL